MNEERIEKQDLKESFNRRQRRIDEKIKRKKSRNNNGELYVTRKELVALFQSMQKLRDRLYYVDILSSAIENVLLQKGVITKEEFEEFFKEEGNKALAFQEIQQGKQDYENRLKKCVELGIDPNVSVIANQIYEDAELTTEEKLRLAELYDLKILLSVLKANSHEE